jgi:hypothetical protein
MKIFFYLEKNKEIEKIKDKIIKEINDLETTDEEDEEENKNLQISDLVIIISELNDKTIRKIKEKIFPKIIINNQRQKTRFLLINSKDHKTINELELYFNLKILNYEDYSNDFSKLLKTCTHKHSIPDEYHVKPCNISVLSKTNEELYNNVFVKYMDEASNIRYYKDNLLVSFYIQFLNNDEKNEEILNEFDVFVIIEEEGMSDLFPTVFGFLKKHNKKTILINKEFKEMNSIEMGNFESIEKITITDRYSFFDKIKEIQYSNHVTEPINKIQKNIIIYGSDVKKVYQFLFYYVHREEYEHGCYIPDYTTKIFQYSLLNGNDVVEMNFLVDDFMGKGFDNFEGVDLFLYYLDDEIDEENMKLLDFKNLTFIFQKDLVVGNSNFFKIKSFDLNGIVDFDFFLIKKIK